MVEHRLLYLVRHGIAAERGPEYPDDARRPLTPEGKVRMREVVAGLVAAGVQIDEVLTSPFVRARQTSELLAAGWPQAPRIVEVDALAVGGRSSDVFAALVSKGRPARLALVGHMPSLGILAAELLGAPHPLNFKKGGVACIEVDRTPARGAGTLLWFAPPRLLRRAGRD